MIRRHERIDRNIISYDFLYLTGESCLIGKKTGNYYSDAG